MKSNETIEAELELLGYKMTTIDYMVAKKTLNLLMKGRQLMAKVFTFVTEPTPTYAKQYINRHGIKPEDLVTFQWLDNNHTLIGYWKNESISHETLPDRIHDYYPCLNNRELAKTCYEQYYYYTAPGFGIVGGFDGKFYVMDYITKGKKYLETGK